MAAWKGAAAAQAARPNSLVGCQWRLAWPWTWGLHIPGDLPRVFVLPVSLKMNAGEGTRAAAHEIQLESKGGVLN